MGFVLNINITRSYLPVFLYLSDAKWIHTAHVLISLQMVGTMNLMVDSSVIN